MTNNNNNINNNNNNDSIDNGDDGDDYIVQEALTHIRKIGEGEFGSVYQGKNK